MILRTRHIAAACLIAACHCAALGQADSIRLREVVVTASEVRHASSVSKIDSQAMKHLQPSSFTDLLELLPGGISRDPAVGSVNTIALRQAVNISPADDYATSALGTAFVIDGMPVSTSANMQSTPDGNQQGRIATGKGVDMRALSTDDIESVEIVRGIPSVEYGELSAGLVKVKRKNSVSRLEARFKADTKSQLMAVSKGFAMPGNDWIVNAGVNYLDSRIDPRNARESFKRVGASLRSDKRWASDVITLHWNSALSYSVIIENDNDDPDLTINNTIDDFHNASHSATWVNTLDITPVARRAFAGASITAGAGCDYEHLSQRKHVAPSRVMPLPVSMQPGSNYVGYLPMLYLARYDVYGIPLSAYAKAVARFSAGSGAARLNAKAGMDWNMSKNYGRGPVYDITRPISATNTGRPRPFRDVPAMNQLSAFAEADLRLDAGRHTLMLTAGLRETQLMLRGSAYAIDMRPYVDPRFNLVWQLPSVDIGCYPIMWELAVGWGLHTKMPVAAYLYPAPAYIDFEQLNYYHNVEAYRVMNVRTYVDDKANYDLLAARNAKREVRVDVSYRGNRLSVTCFDENMANGFRSSGFIRRYAYNRYDASAFDPYAAGRAPSISELPSEQVLHLAVLSKYTNGSRTRKRGVEYTFMSRRLPRLMTRLTINGAYFRTTNNNSQALWYKPSVIANGKPLEYVGLYDDTDGSVYESFNTNFLFDTDVPALRLNVSLGAQCLWFTSRRSLWRDGVPTHYADPQGDIREFTSQSAADPYLSQLIRTFADSYFEKYTVPASVAFNIKATKTFWHERVGIALYVNRILAIQPDYMSHGVIVRRYSSPYFGMELNLKI